MIRAILKKSWKQRPAKKQLYDHLPPISKTNEQDMRDTAEEVSKDFLWTSLHERVRVEQLTITYLQQVCMDAVV